MSAPSALSSLTVPKLKEICRELGIPVSGKKAELITRIETKRAAAAAATVRGAAAEDGLVPSFAPPTVPTALVLSTVPRVPPLKETASTPAETLGKEDRRQNIRKQNQDQAHLSRSSQGGAQIPKRRKIDGMCWQTGQDAKNELGLSLQTSNSQEHPLQLRINESKLPRFGQKYHPDNPSLVSNAAKTNPSAGNSSVNVGETVPSLVVAANRGQQGLSKVSLLKPLLRPSVLKQNEAAKGQPSPLEVAENPKNTNAIVFAEDFDISWVPIRFPPRIAQRKATERLGHVLSIIAHHTADFKCGAGEFLKLTVMLNKAYHYASILAYTSLCTTLEFPGKRTAEWIRKKKVDVQTGDCRRYYWCRFREVETRVGLIERYWWVERVWNAYKQAKRMKRTEYGLWFGGVSSRLLCENEAVGQWDVAARFWATRFCRNFFSGKKAEGFGFSIMFENADKILDALPIGQHGAFSGARCGSRGANVSDIWKVATHKELYIVIAATGEAIGTVQANTRSKGSNRINLGWHYASKVFNQPAGTNMESNINEILWKDPRLDWRSYLTSLLSSNDGKPASALVSQIYHPSPMQYVNAIHISIPINSRHRTIAERFVLAHVEPQCISGGEGNPVSGFRKIGLDIDAKWRVHSVVCSREILKNGNGVACVLADGIAFVQTDDGVGWYVLEDTGDVIGQEDYGIESEIWKAMLAVDANGELLGGKEYAESQQRLEALFSSLPEL